VLLTPLRVNSATHPGLHHSRNEDAHTVVPSPDGVLLAVCDGMGGMGRADEASRLAIDVLTSAWVAGSGDPLHRLQAALHTADLRVREALCSGGTDRPGATAVLVYVEGSSAHVAWVGDSRAYLIRDGEVVARTRDHKLVEELVDAGQITPDEAKESPLAHVVTRALGGRSPSEPPVVAAAIDPWPLYAGDRLVLCSDGVCDLLSDPELAEIVHDTAPSDTVQRLVEAALLRGGHDNITVIVAEWDGDRAYDDAETPIFAPERAMPLISEEAATPIRLGGRGAPSRPRTATAGEPSARGWVAVGLTFLLAALLAAVTTIRST
jgi:PPM family protein phosphatase